MVQKVSTIRKCKRSDTGMGFVLLGFQTNLQATSSGAAKNLWSAITDFFQIHVAIDEHLY